MEQPRQRRQENIIINGQSPLWRLMIDVLLTCFFWIYSLLIATFFISAAFNFNNAVTRLMNDSFNTDNGDIRLLLLIAAGIFILFSISLSLNRIYNIKRFGSLKRRTYPRSTSMEELVGLNLVDEATIWQLQENNYIIFEKNPIVSLGQKK